MRLQLEDMTIEGAKRLVFPRHEDARGRFERLFSASDLPGFSDASDSIQINRSHTIHPGTVRGMHMQLAPHAEAKVVKCLEGAAFDVGVDLRKWSPTFMHHVSIELRADADQAVLWPKGVAHGFQALEPDTQLLYVHSTEYSPDAEFGVSPLDPLLAIEWPMQPHGLSERDSSHPLLGQEFNGVTV